MQSLASENRRPPSGQQFLWRPIGDQLGPLANTADDDDDDEDADDDETAAQQQQLRLQLHLNRRLLTGARRGRSASPASQRPPDEQPIDVEEAEEAEEEEEEEEEESDHYVQQDSPLLVREQSDGESDERQQRHHQHQHRLALDEQQDGLEVGANMLIAGSSRSPARGLDEIRSLLAKRVRASGLVARPPDGLHGRPDSPELALPLDLKVSPSRPPTSARVPASPSAISGGLAGAAPASAGAKAVQAKLVQSSSTSSKSKANKQRRLYKCRHCNFETDKKVDNWQHIRIHMRPEKLLACESCQFVTEYKHHLEYHQRNHSGYKPFKCDHCDYQCVNKSMLNSHMKSHSSVYQYQCGDCKYATKYVHSLKMHLRKYNHKPTQLMIDVYGRKRGPKSSSSSSSSTGQQDQQQQQQQQSQQQQQQQQCILDLRVDSKLASQS